MCSVKTEEFPAPKWLGNDFLEDHLRIYYNHTEIKVISFDVKPATGKGENFASLIYRVNAKFNAPSKSEPSKQEVSVNENNFHTEN